MFSGSQQAAADLNAAFIQQPTKLQGRGFLLAIEAGLMPSDPGDFFSCDHACGEAFQKHFADDHGCAAALVETLSSPSILTLPCNELLPTGVNAPLGKGQASGGLLAVNGQGRHDAARKSRHVANPADAGRRGKRQQAGQHASPGDQAEA
jgi:hypothetical protein